jgi:hypothetical protein
MATTWSDQYLLGYARVNLHALIFRTESGRYKIKKKPTKKTIKNITHLVSVFQKTGCQNNNKEHALPATIDENVLANALKGVDLPKIITGEVPLINIGPVQCLRGGRRVAAGKIFLDADRFWWTVAFYSTGNFPYYMAFKNYG